MNFDWLKPHEENDPKKCEEFFLTCSMIHGGAVFFLLVFRDKIIEIHEQYDTKNLDHIDLALFFKDNPLYRFLNSDLIDPWFVAEDNKTFIYTAIDSKCLFVDDVFSRNGFMSVRKKIFLSDDFKKKLEPYSYPLLSLSEDFRFKVLSCRRTLTDIPFYKVINEANRVWGEEADIVNISVDQYPYLFIENGSITERLKPKEIRARRRTLSVSSLRYPSYYIFPSGHSVSSAKSKYDILLSDKMVYHLIGQLERQGNEYQYQMVKVIDDKKKVISCMTDNNRVDFQKVYKLIPKVSSLRKKAYYSYGDYYLNYALASSLGNFKSVLTPINTCTKIPNSASQTSLIRLLTHYLLDNISTSRKYEGFLFFICRDRIPFKRVVVRRLSIRPHSAELKESFVKPSKYTKALETAITKWLDKYSLFTDSFSYFEVIYSFGNKSEVDLLQILRSSEEEFYIKA